MDTGESQEGNYCGRQREGMSSESERETADFQNKMGNIGNENGLTPEIYKASKILQLNL